MYIVDQYLAENGLKRNAGAGAAEPKPTVRGTAPIEPVDGPGGSDGECADQLSDTEASSEDDVDAEASRETHVLKMLYAGNVAETNRRDEQARKAKIYNRKHDYITSTRDAPTLHRRSRALCQPASSM